MKKNLLPMLAAAALACSLQTVFAESKTPETTVDSGAVTQGMQGRNQYSWLGVVIQPVPMPLANQLSGQLKENQGIMVRSVHPDSPASKAGLQAFDVISGFNDQEIYTTDQFSHLIRSTKPGTAVKLHLIRQSKLQTLDITPEVQPGLQPKQPPRGYRPHPAFPSPHDFNQMPFPQPGFDSRPSYPNRYSQPGRQEHYWSEFESVQIESIGSGKYKAAVKYEDSEGNKQDFRFEGTMNDIYEQIMSHKTLPENKKRSLLQALDMNMAPPMNNPWQGMPDPDWFRQNQLPVPPWYRQ